MKIKKGDTVVVIAGKDKGKRGEVIATFKEIGKVTVAGINMKTHHVKPTKDGEKGHKALRPGALQASNVAAIDPKSDKATRVGYIFENGKKVRIAKKSKTPLK